MAHNELWLALGEAIPSVGIFIRCPVENTADNGVNIRRVRRTPYIAKENERVPHASLEVLVETGLPSSIQAPSKNVPFVNLQDANGVLWTMTIADNGIIDTAVAGAGQVASNPIVLADNETQATFWLLSVRTNGQVYGVQAAIGNPTFAVFPMATTPTLPNVIPLDIGITFSALGAPFAIKSQPHLREPLLFLRWSDDNGHTWSNYHGTGMGLDRKLHPPRHLAKPGNTAQPNL